MPISNYNIYVIVKYIPSIHRDIYDCDHSRKHNNTAMGPITIQFCVWQYGVSRIWQLPETLARVGGGFGGGGGKWNNGI